LKSTPSRGVSKQTTVRIQKENKLALIVGEREVGEYRCLKGNNTIGNMGGRKEEGN